MIVVRSAPQFSHKSAATTESAHISRRTLSENRTSIFGSMTAVTSPKPKVGCAIVCPYDMCASNRKARCL